MLEARSPATRAVLIAALLCARCAFEPLGPSPVLIPDGGDGTQQRDAGEPDAGEPDAGEPDAGKPDAGDSDGGEPDAGPRGEPCNGLDDDEDGLVDEGPNGEVLWCRVACPARLFDRVSLDEDFGPPFTPAAWVTRARLPTVQGGLLQFGPWAASTTWTDLYSWISTPQSFGDEIACARLRYAPAVGVRDNSFAITARQGGAHFVALTLQTREPHLRLATLLDGETDRWEVHASSPFATRAGLTQRIELLLYVRGDRVVAEAHDLDSGRIVSFADDATMLPPQGPVGFIGWDLEGTVQVERLVVGPPSAEAAALLDRR